MKDVSVKRSPAQGHYQVKRMVAVLGSAPIAAIPDLEVVLAKTPKSSVKRNALAAD